MFWSLNRTTYVYRTHYKLLTKTLRQRVASPLYDRQQHRNTPLRLLASDIIARNPNQLIWKKYPVRGPFCALWLHSKITATLQSHCRSRITCQRADWKVKSIKEPEKSAVPPATPPPTTRSTAPTSPTDNLFWKGQSANSSQELLVSYLTFALGSDLGDYSQMWFLVRTADWLVRETEA